MKIATFNINSVNARLEDFTKWLKSVSPDVVLLQEIKTEYNNFPTFEISACGYHAAIAGQKAYNGVAILSKEPLKILHDSLEGYDPLEARYIEVQLHDTVISSVYMPNGNPIGSEKFAKKLDFMRAFNAHARTLLKNHEKVVIGGDFNVISGKADVYDEEPFLSNALCNEEARKLFFALTYSGYYDAFRTLHPKENGYTYWDYGPTAFANDFGMRIDYIICSAKMAENLISCRVDKSLRQTARPSDHTPLIAEFEP